MVSKMQEKGINFSQDQSGSVSLLVVVIVVMAVSLSYGIVAVAETLIQKKEALYGAQSSVNSAAFVYGQTYVKATRKCVKQKISEELEETLIVDPACDLTQLQTCLDSDFKTCDLDLSICIPDKDDLVQACMNDDEVLSNSMDAAQASAHTIASKYSLKDLQLSLSGETLKMKAYRNVESQVPVLGSTGKLETQAQSTFSLAKKGE